MPDYSGPIASLPPHSFESEEALIASCLQWPEDYYKISGIVTADDFYFETTKILYSAIGEVLSAGILDIQTLALAVEHHPEPNGEGGGGWFVHCADLQNRHGAVEATETYARAIADRSARRKLILAASITARNAYDLSTDTATVISNAEKAIFDVRNDNTADAMKPAEYIPDYLTMLERLRSDGKIDGVGTGFVEIDKLLNGFQSPQLYVMAARPGMGKSLLALNMAEAATREGKRVVFFSLEMSAFQIMNRRISALTGVDSKLIQTPWKLNDAQYIAVKAASEEILERPLVIDDTGGITPAQVRAKSMRLHALGKVDLIIVDHLILMRPDRDLKRTDSEYGEMTMALAETAKLIGCPVLCLTQLNRGVEARQNKRPMLSDLRESGRIEENAYCVFFLYRDDYYDDESPDKNITEVLIRKQRDGATGTVKLYHDLARSRFSDLQVEEWSL